MLYTEDGGENWHIQKANKKSDLSSPVLLDSKRAWRTLSSVEDQSERWFKEKFLKQQPKEIIDLLEERDEEDDPLWGIDLIDHDRNCSCISMTKVLLNQAVKTLLFITEDNGKTWKRLEPQFHKYPWRPCDLENEGNK